MATWDHMYLKAVFKREKMFEKKISPRKFSLENILKIYYDKIINNIYF